jgi:xylose isomerase
MNETKTVLIGKKEYQIKFTFRALIDFEKLSGHTVSFETLENALMLFYCLHKAAVRDQGVEIDSFETLLDEIDNYPDAMTDIYQALTDLFTTKKKK